MDRFKKKTDENGERTSLKIKISMRKTAKMIAVVSCSILMLAACSPGTKPGPHGRGSPQDRP